MEYSDVSPPPPPIGIGNKYADAGDFYMAVKYFTDAIRFNPTEVR